MENLTITTICRADSDVFNELTRLAAKNECHIHYSHLNSLGLDYAIVLQITGNWSGIAKIEAALPGIATRMNTEIVFKRSHQEKMSGQFLPYRFEIIGLDQAGLVYEINEFFGTQEINIQNWQTHTTTLQQTPIFKLQLTAQIPAESNIADIREQFLIFCDEFNLDGIMEPEK